MVLLACQKMALPRRLMLQSLVSRYYRSVSMSQSDHHFVPLQLASLAETSKRSSCLFQQKSSQLYLHTSSPRNEIVQFHLSDIGEGIKEVTIKEW